MGCNTGVWGRRGRRLALLVLAFLIGNALAAAGALAAPGKAKCNGAHSKDPGCSPAAIGTDLGGEAGQTSPETQDDDGAPEATITDSEPDQIGDHGSEPTQPEASTGDVASPEEGLEGSGQPLEDPDPIASADGSGMSHKSGGTDEASSGSSDGEGEGPAPSSEESNGAAPLPNEPPASVEAAAATSSSAITAVGAPSVTAQVDDPPPDDDGLLPSSDDEDGDGETDDAGTGPSGLPQTGIGVTGYGAIGIALLLAGIALMGAARSLESRAAGALPATSPLETGPAAARAKDAPGHRRKALLPSSFRHALSVPAEALAGGAFSRCRPLRFALLPAVHPRYHRGWWQQLYGHLQCKSIYLQSYNST